MIRLLKNVFRLSQPATEETKLDFETVEPRVLFSATPLDSTEGSGVAHHDLPIVQEEAPAYLPARGDEPDLEMLQMAAGDGALLLDGLNAYADEMAEEGRREIVFISTDIEDYEYLVSNLDPSYEVFLIDSESDGIGQIAAALEGVSGVDAIHLLTHGSEGRLFLAGTEVNAETIEGIHRDGLEAIRASLSEDADFLLYGCDFTAGEDGLVAAELLSTILGADIAASTDGTGHADLGGDWDLETEVGLIESEMLSMEGWNGLLAPIVIVNTNNATTLANNIIGGGISLGTATYTGSAAQAGTFTSATGYTPEWLGYSSGIILTTGATSQIPGPNTNGGSSINAPSSGTGADAGLAALGGGSSFDASILNFTFTPTGNRITMQFTFGSDEYNEYVYSNFNDAMGVWVNGIQVALTPTGDPVSVNSINRAGTFNPSQGNQANDPNPANGVYDSANPNLYINNEPGSAAYNTGMDGFTVTLSFVANVNVGVSNTIRIGIADIGDEQWDSWLFVREDSLTATTIAMTDNVATAVNTPVIINALANDWDANGDPLTITHVLDKPITAGGPAVVLASGSSVALNLNGTLTFTPATGSTADEVFTYTISDGTGSTAVGFINVDINQTPVNTVPVAQTTTEDTNRIITGLSVSDVDSTALTTTLSLPAGAGTITATTGGGATITGNGSGTVTVSGTAAQINAAIGSITYAPTADFNTGSPSVPINLTVATTDGVSTDTDTVAITVTPVVDIVADSISTTEDTPRVFNAITGTNGASADNFENGGRAISSVTQGANGSVTFLANGQITYTPNANFFGTDSFTYTVTSGGVTETATVSVNVSAVNDAPVNTVPAAQVATEDTNRIITGVSIADVDSTSLTTTLSIPGTAGTLSVLTGGGAAISGNGTATVTVSGTAAQINAAIASITYVPLADFNTATGFNLTVATSDGTLSDSRTVAITVNAAADIVADTVATNEETAITFNAITGTNGATADSFENAGRAITSVTQGVNGSVTFLANGQITYTPNLNFFGSDSFTYTVTSGGVTETATVTVNVAAVNDVPVNTVPAAQVATEDTNRIITGVSIADVDSTSLTTTLSIPGTAGTLSVLTGGGATISGNGTATVTVAGTAAQINAAIASITYVPLADFNTATGFNLTVATSDGTLSDSRTVAITVNAAADIVADTVATNEETAITFNAITGTNGATADSFENAGRAITSVTQGANGSVTFLANGQITYTPNLNFFGTDTFTYTVSSGGVTETATVTVNVAAVNDAPVNTVPAAQVATEDTNRIITGVSVVDVDSTSLTTTLSIPGTTGTLSVLTGGGATITGNGTATVVVSGTAAQINAAIASITCVPLADFNTATAFNLTVATSDGFLTDTDTVAITVNAVSDIVADTVATNEDTAVVFNAITGTNGASADNFENGGRAITSVTQGANGSVTFLANGQITYTPNTNFFGSDSFTYTVTSGGVTETATVTVNVAAVNDAPDAVDDDFVAGEDDGPVVVGNAITNNDTDIDGDDLAAVEQTGVTGSAGGLFSIDEDGVVIFDANGDFEDLVTGQTRETTFTYTIEDGAGGTDTATVTVTVSGANDAPVVTGFIGTQWNEDSESVSLDLSGFFSDADSSDDLIYTATGLPAGLSLDPDTGLLSGTIASSASAGGPYTVEVTVNDGNGGLITQTFTWNVFNPAPVAANDDFAGGENDAAAVVGNVLINDGDPDNDAISAQVASGGGNNGGQFTIAANGAVTFDADGDFDDLAVGETRETTFTYTLVDADGATSTALITVTVTGANDAPVVIVGNTDRTDADSAAISLDISVYFDDVDGSDVLIYSATGLPDGLSIDAATGIISGTIDSSASVGGPYSIEVTAEDGSGATVMHAFVWTVTNPAPIAVADEFTADEDDAAAVVGNALANDSDPDGDSYSAQIATGISGSNGGVFSIAANGDVTFDPAGVFNSLAAGETAVTSFTYTLIDADGATTTATFTVEVTGENDAPVAVGTIATQSSADAEVIAGLDLSGFFTDPDSGDVLSYSASGLPAGLTIDSATGVISGTIGASASVGGPYTVLVTATDENGALVTQSFSWQIFNPGPLAENDDFTAGEGDAAAVVGNAILNNDSDPDGDALSAVVQSGVAGTQGGLFSIAANGEVTFDPNGQFEDLAVGETRTTSFTYTLVDADGATSTATVTVDVAGANDVPVTVGTITTQDSLDSDVISLGTAGFFSDPDTTDVLTYRATGLPVGLTIDAATGVISGTIDSSASASGPYTVEVTATDEDGSAITQTFTWNVTNPGPVANDDDFTTVENVVGTVGNVITNNDTDPDNDALSVVAQNGVTGSDGGIFSIAANGEVSFDPNGEFDDLAFGESRTTSLTYTLVDADGATSTAAVTITVNGANSAPFTVGTVPTQNNDDDDSVSLDLSGYFDDLDGSDVLEFSATGLPDGLTIDAATGVISGTIDSSASAAGPYTVEVTVADGNGGSVSLNFTWNVTNPGPVAVDDTFVADEDESTAVVGNVIVGSDSDPDGDSLAVQVVNLVAGSEGGLFSIAANGDVTFDPNGEFEDLAVGETRETSLAYTLVDADGATSTATVTITVTGANDAPVTVGTVAAQSAIDGQTIAPVNLAVHFDDVDHGAVLSYSATGLPTGLVIDSVTGIISGTINSSASQDGPFSVIITASDGLGGSVTQSFVWTVTNPGPVAKDDAFTALEDSGLTVVGNAITNNDSDPDNDALSAVAGTDIAGSEGGLFSIAANGEVSFDPNGEFEDLAVGETRETSFTYTLVDADGATTTATVTVTVTGANDAPVSVGSINTQSSVDSAVISLATSAFFADADASDVPSYSATGLPTGLVIDGTTGVISGTINSSASVAGPYTVVVTMADGNGGSATQTFSWIVSNPAPLAQDDAFTALEDDAAAVVGNAITNNDSDPDSDALTAVAATGVAGSSGGLFSINESGEVSFDANRDFEDLGAGETRTTNFTYTVVDADGASAQATVTVEVTGENDAPENVGVIGTQVSEDSDVVTLDVSGFFSDKDLSDTLSYTATGLPAGLVIDAATGIISGTIDSSASQDGPFSVSVTAADGEGESVTQTFSWTVSNPTPIANDDAFSVSEDDSLAVIGNVITAGDSDPDGDSLSVVAGSNIAGSHGGLFSIAANGDVSFDPNGAFEDLATGETRTTSFTYTLVDVDGATATATVTVTVTGMNDAPTTVGSVATRGNADSEVIAPFDVTSFFADADLTDVMEYSATGLPSGLTIDAATGIISGTIASSASTGGPYSVTVTASDGNGGSVEQTFTWLVSNPAPNAVNDTYGIGEDDAVTVLGNVIGNDGDPDGDALSVVAVSGAAGSEGGLFTINGTGEVSFDPNGAFEDLAAGETRETSYTYTLVDADGATSQATVTVTVTGANDAPVRNGSVPAQVSEDSDAVMLNVSGAFGDADASDVLRYRASGLPAGLSINEETGVISGTIDSSASASGPYTVVVTVDDDHGGTTTQTFIWTVTNPGPVAGDDSFVADEDDAAAIVGNAITGSDSDPDGDAVSAQVQSGVAGSHGGLFSIEANGDVTFDPNGAFEDLAAGETRETRFVYILTDADGATTSATVTVVVTGENDAPVGIGSIATRNSIDGEIISLDLSGFFSDPDVSDVLSYSAAGLPAGLTIDSATGIISGTIASSASAAGPYAAMVTGQDASGLFVSLSFTWNVTNPVPVAQGDAFAAGEDDASLVVGNVLGNDSDPDNDTLTVVPVNQLAGSTGGLFTINAAGNVTFSPDGDFEDLAAGETRETGVSYTLVDADGATATATITVTVTGANDAPVVTTALPDQSHQDSETINPVDISNFFADGDGTDSLLYSASGLPAGLIIDEMTGLITGTLHSSASAGGPYLVEVKATDGAGASISSSFTWTVVNPAPIANNDQSGGGQGSPAPGAEGAEDDRFTALEDDTAALVGNALENDYDLDGDDLVAVVQTGVSGSQGGIFSIAVNGDVTFDPADDFQDLAAGETRETTFTYTLVDADGGTAMAVVTVTVSGSNDGPVVVSVTDDQEDADNTPVNLDMSVFFADVDLGDELTYSATNLPTGLSIDETTGLVSGTIDHAASGEGPFHVTVTATDSSGAMVTTEFVWTVTNPAPIAVDDQFDAMANGGVVVLGNVISGSDSDSDGDALATVPLEDIAGSNGGFFRIDAEGNVTFDPNGAFDDLLGGQSRETSFTYTLIDSDGATSTATVTVRVLAVNAPPVPQSGAIRVTTGARGETIRLKAPVDPDGDRLTIKVTKLPRTGVLRLANGKAVSKGQVLSASQLEKLVFDAPDSHKGKKPVIFRYQVSDGQVTTHAKVKIKIVRGVMTVKCQPLR